MGITQKSLDRLMPFLHSGINMLELGAQNLYDNKHYNWIAKDYFVQCHIKHRSVDIIGHQGSEKVDLRDDITWGEQFDIVTDYGTCEHIDGDLYQPFLNIHNACKIDGIIIHENPRFDHWPLHGQHYFSMDFYKELGYEILELCEEPAMGNYETGMNVCAVLRKNNIKFMSKRTFNKIYTQHIKSK